KLDNYLGIQRRLSKNRVAELERYIDLPDSTFPTSIVLCLSSNDVNLKRGEILEIRDVEDVAKVIDGQHRIASLARYEGTFDVPVSIFIDMDIEEQASLFTSINLAQTPVSKSLLYDLYEYSKIRSPQKTAHNI